MIIVVKKKTLILIGICLILCISVASIIYGNLNTSTLTTSEKLIVIDPGHGGHDPGAIGGSGVLEKDINFSISMKLKDLLQQAGYTVILTRESDVSIHDTGAKSKKTSDIKNRKKIVENNNPKVFVSIHLNSFPQKQYYGAQVFYSPNSESSKLLAQTIQSEFKSIDSTNDRKAKEIKNVALLRGLSVTSVIVECGFLSNPVEEKLLTKDEHQQKVAQAIYLGIMKFVSIPIIEDTKKVSI